MADPTETDPDKYQVAVGNERVRVLEYHGAAGQRTNGQVDPDSVMITLSSFDRRLIAVDGQTRDER